MMSTPTKPNTRGPGRPTKRTNQRLQYLFEAISTGAPLKSAAAVSGISVSTLGEWRKIDPQIDEEIERCQEKARAAMLKVIKNAAEAGDYRAAEAYLKLVWPEYRNNSKLQVTNTSNVINAVVLTEQRREELMDRWRRLQEEDRSTPASSAPISHLQAPETGPPMLSAEDKARLAQEREAERQRQLAALERFSSNQTQVEYDPCQTRFDAEYSL